MRIAPAGDRAQLVTFGEITAAELHARAREWRAREGVLAVVPGHSSLLVVFGGAGARGAEVVGGVAHSIGVSFHPRHAPDLDELLARIALSRAAFIDRIAQLRLTARFLGFRAGFAYLDGWPEEWSMPRRPTSRPVPHGSFAIAGATAGFYPIDSPGGWNLLGRSSAVPRIAAGDEITIVPTLDDLAIAPLPAPPREELDGVEFLSAPLATVVRGEDWSRVAHGESPGGAFDDVAAALANCAAGNADDAPLLECAMTAPRLRTSRLAMWCGPDLEVRPFENIGRIEGGLRGYVAFGGRSGSVNGLPGSRVAGLPGTPGQRDLQPGNPATWQPGNLSARQRENRFLIHALRGPHESNIPDSIECEVTPQINRVGIRLRPLTAIDVEAPADLKSCGMLCGTVQLHPDGSLVVMGPDHPVTGGYLQPVTVLSSERWKLAQLAPGDRVRIVVQSTT